MSDQDLIGIGTKFEEEAIRWLRRSSGPKNALDYLQRRYDALVGDEVPVSELRATDNGKRGWWVRFDPVTRKSSFFPEDEIDPKRRYGGIRDYCLGSFFGKDNGSLIAVACNRLYGGESRMRAPIWRYVTGRQLRERDYSRLGISEE